MEQNFRANIWTSAVSNLVRSFMYWMVPGGSVSRVKVLFTAMVIRHVLPGLWRRTPPTSASKGRWPPACSVILTPFTHCNMGRITDQCVTVTNQMSQRHLHHYSCDKSGKCVHDKIQRKESLMGFSCTYKHRIIVRTSNSEHDPCSLVLDPAVGNPHFLLIPHPANEIPDFGILCDVVVAGRHRHVNHWTRLE